jgi:hypothetical protein
MLREIEQAKQQASHAKFGIVFLKLLFVFLSVCTNCFTRFNDVKSKKKKNVLLNCLTIFV